VGGSDCISAMKAFSDTFQIVLIILSFCPPARRTFKTKRCVFGLKVDVLFGHDASIRVDGPGVCGHGLCVGQRTIYDW
jgi:hypothetical protein